VFVAALAGLTRAQLEALVVLLKGEKESLERDLKQALENLTSTQARCTELLEEVRTWRRSSSTGSSTAGT
jgi:hypothetical protein